jgi:hypothetical protein
VDLITCNFDSLNYLLVIDDLLRTLEGFHANLTPGGCLIFDMITPYQPWRGPKPWVEQTRWNGYLFQRRMEIASRTGMQKSVIRISRDGRTSREVHRQRVYPTQTVVTLLRRAHLLPQGLYDFYSLLPPTNATRRVVYVARKRAG